MVNLNCVLVGVVGNAFPVDIEETISVGELKRIIWKEENLVTRDPSEDASNLELYLSKQDNMWLTKEDIKSVSLDKNRQLIGFEHMDEMKDILEYIGVSFERKRIHVLVVPPIPSTPPETVIPANLLNDLFGVHRDRPGEWLTKIHTTPSIAVPIGAEVDLCSCDKLLTFLESEMINKDKIISNPHECVEFRLVGREMAIDSAARCFQGIIANRSVDEPDRTKNAIIPVCSGISGLGKTRMLEEGKNILEDMVKIDRDHIVSLIVRYDNGHTLQPVEQSMSIEASFSWRLLYQFFLEKNCSSSFKTWFHSKLPCNGADLTFENAIEVVERKVGKKQEPIYLFLGVDEYQKIELDGARQNKNSQITVLHELVETIGDFMCTKSTNLVVLPMFAGTNLSVITPGTMFNSPFYLTQRLPMNLLTLDQVFTMAENNIKYAELLNYKQICRNLFFLGGVPRWVVEYLSGMKSFCKKGKPVSLENIVRCYTTTRRRYVDDYMSSLEMSKLIRLAAFSVSGLLVHPNDLFDEKLKWSRLRDSSLCVLVPLEQLDECVSFTSDYESDQYGVQVPYTLLRTIGSRHRNTKNDATNHLVNALNDLKQLVDKNLFYKQPWELWGIFGACFYAVRINALIVLGYSSVTLEELLPGALMTDATREVSVELVPSRIFQCAEPFGASTPEEVTRRDNENEKINWTSAGCIVVNGVNGAGVDIFFALKESGTDKLVVVVDQRKQEFGRFYPSKATTYLNKLNVCPTFLQAKNARLVRGIMNCVASSNLTTFEIPDNCFLVSRNESVQFHGTLAYHPACSPVVSIKSACKTALKTVFHGTGKEVDEVVEEIVRKRKEPDGGFSNTEDLVSFIKSKRFSVQLINERVEF